MIYEFHINGETFHMEFEEHIEAQKALERDLYGYTYMLNGRTYQELSMRTSTGKEYFTATRRSLHLISATGSGTVRLTSISCTTGKTSTWSPADRATGSRN